MTDAVDTDALRAIAQGFDAKGWVNNAQHCRAAADEVDRLRAENATWQRQWTNTLVAATDSHTETQRLRAVIENAPHANGCDMATPDFYRMPTDRCTCWKADVL